MLLVVTGAGASFDSSLEVPPGSHHPRVSPYRHSDTRLPLTDDLFAPDRPYSDNGASNRRMQALVPELRRAIENGTGLEAALGVVAERAARDPETRRQLSAMRHYLLDVVDTCQHGAAGHTGWWKRTAGITAYTDLVEQVRQLTVDSGVESTFVTFNYDTLLDEAARGSGLISPRCFDSYIDGPVRIFRPHGSADWRYLLDAVDGDPLRVKNPPSTEELKEAQIVWPDHTSPSQESVLYPAIAIPVDNKTGLDFTCPPGHLDALAALLPSTTAILSIGWRASEPHFADLLRSVPSDVPIWSAAGLDDGGAADNLRNLGFINVTDLRCGFVDTVNSGLEAVLAGNAQPAA
jgi:hypothetical protein